MIGNRVISASNMVDPNADPYFNYVKALLFNDSAPNGTTSVLNQSNSGLVFTSSATSYSNTTAPTGLTTSMYTGINGSDRISTPDSPLITLSTSDFCIETYARFISLRTYQCIYSQNAGSLWFGLGGASDQNTYFQTSVGTITFPYLPVINVWNHFALVRVGNIVRFFVNGVKTGVDKAFTGNIPDMSTILSLASSTSGVSTEKMNGYLGGFRLTIGHARYTGNSFTPPTLPLQIR